jgi:hypothetical protein
MATNDMKMTGTNQAQNQYLNYYNQTQKYLGSNAPTIQAPQIQAPQALQYQAVAAPSKLNANLIQAPSQLNAAQIASPGAVKTAQVATPGAMQAAQIGNLGNLKVTNVATPGALQAAQVAAPGTLQAALVTAPTISSQAPKYTAPERISVERINTDMQSQAELANQIAAYLRPYTENAINARRQQTAQNRAAIDVDAASRGMGSSTWVTDAKLRQAQAEAADIANLENTFIGNVQQGVFQADQAQRERAQQAAIQNAANMLAADTTYGKLAADRANALFGYGADVNLKNAELAYDAAKANAANQMAAGQFNIGNNMDVNQFNAQLRQNAATDTYGARNTVALQNAAAANAAAQAMYSANANRLTDNAQLAQQAAMATYDARNTAALQNAGILNDAYRLGYSTQAGVNEANAQLRQAANLAYFNAMNERNAQNAGYLNQFAMYNNDNAYNAAIAERAYRDALAAQGIDWRMAADQWNGQMAYNAAVQNADLWTTLQQLAWQRASDMYGLNPVMGGGGTGPNTEQSPTTPPVNIYYAPYSEPGPAAPVANVTPNTASTQGWLNTIANLVTPSVKDGAASTPSSTKTSNTGKKLPPLNKPSKK